MQKDKHNGTIKQKDSTCGRSYKAINGYFTVEAAFILPMTLWMIVFIMCVMFYQYDRCLLEQDIGVLALRGAVEPDKDAQEVLAGIKEQAEALYAEKYAAMGKITAIIKVNGGKVVVEGKGSLQFPPINNWNLKASFTNKRLDPVLFIRACRRLNRERT